MGGRTVLHRDPLKCQELHTQWQSVTSQKKSIFTGYVLHIHTTNWPRRFHFKQEP